MSTIKYGPARAIVIILIVVFLALVFCTLALAYITNSWINGLRTEKDAPSIESHADIVWTMEFDGKIISTPIMKENTLYVQTSKSFSSSDIITGKKLWIVKLRGGSNSNAPFVLCDNIIYASIWGNEIVAINAQTGIILWRSILDENYDEPTLDMYVQNGTLYIAKYMGRIYALDILTGEIKWVSYGTDRSNMWVLGKDNSIFIIGNRKVLILREDDGFIESEIQTGITTSVVIQDDGITYLLGNGIVNRNNSISILSVDVRQVDNVDHLPIPSQNCAIANENELIIAGNGILRYNLEGKQIIWYQSDYENLSCPLVDGNYIFVREMEGDLYEFSLITGELIGRWNLYSDTFNIYEFAVDPLITNEVIILQTTKNSLSAVKTHDLLSDQK